MPPKITMANATDGQLSHLLRGGSGGSCGGGDGVGGSAGRAAQGLTVGIPDGRSARSCASSFRKDKPVSSHFSPARRAFHRIESDEGLLRK
jgi:hypothetical protein